MVFKEKYEVNYLMEINTQDDKKKPLQRKYKHLKIVIILILLVSFVLYLPTYSLTDTEKVIRNAAAESINMDPNEFSWRDYSKVTKLNLSGKEISDVRFIRKFKNLKILNLRDLIIPDKEIPKWRIILQKYHIIKPKPIKIPTPKPKQKAFIISSGDITGIRQMLQQVQSFQNILKGDSIDLKPLRKLTKLQVLDLGNRISPKKWEIPLNDMYPGIIPFQNLESLSSLKNLKQINLDNTLISDLESLKDFKYLQYLFLNETDVNDLGPLKYMTNLKTLFITNTHVTDLDPIRKLVSLSALYVAGTEITNLEPLRGLSNLSELEIDRTNISDIEPIMRLKNLHELWMYQCEKITDEQVEDLQNSLPNLKIYRHF